MCLSITVCSFAVPSDSIANDTMTWDDDWKGIAAENLPNGLGKLLIADPRSDGAIG